MKWPQFRFTVRRLMLLVAILALICASAVTWWRINDYRTRAEAHKEIELRLKDRLVDAPNRERERSADSLKVQEELERELRGLLGSIKSTEEVEAEIAATRSKHVQSEAYWSAFWKDQEKKDRVWMEWHARMKEKYRHAMWHPWEYFRDTPAPPEPLPASYDVRQ
jgi:hypothetical protein